MKIYTTQPNVLSWHHVDYQVQVQTSASRLWPFNRVNGFKKVLNDVSGKLETGQMVAIIGASGAGKTTLIAALTQRIRGNKFTGEFALNGELVDQDDMTNISGFVPQYDSAISVLTVEEHLKFMATLKLPPSISRIEKNIRIQTITKQLGIVHLAHCRIKNLSGGEKRKLTLATELLRDPLFLFCDEPTTGLDSFNASSILQTLKRLVEKKSENLYQQIIVHQKTKSPIEADFHIAKPSRGVICSIHQPSSEVFDYFSHIILVHNGQIMFHGSKETARVFFQNLGFMCPSNYNPAEFYLNLVTSQLFATPQEFEKHIADMQRTYEAITYFEPYKFDSVKKKKSDVQKRYNRNWMIQLLVLLKRSVIVSSRSFNESIWSSLSLMIMAFMIGVLYSNVDNSQTSIMDIRGALFLIVVQVFFSQYKGVISTFTPQLPNIRREVGEKVYNLSAFYIMTVIIWIPRALIGSFFLFGIVYYFANFAINPLTYVAMSISLSLTVILSQSYGYMWGCVFGQSLGTEISAPIDMFMMIFGGLYLNLDTLPYYKYFSIFYYPNEAISYQYWTAVKKIQCPLDDDTLPCLRNGTEVLKNYALNYQWYTIYLDYTSMILISWALLIIGFYGLKRYVNKEGFY